MSWLLWPALLPDANGEVVGSVHTAFTVCQVFAAPLGSRPDVQADQGSPPKASSSFTSYNQLGTQEETKTTAAESSMQGAGSGCGHGRRGPGLGVGGPDSW